MDAFAKFAFLAVLTLGVVIACARPLGKYIADVMEERATFATRSGAPLERLIYRACGIDPSRGMSCSHYAIALLLFNLLGALVIYALQRLRPWLPLNPQHLAAVSADCIGNFWVDITRASLYLLLPLSVVLALALVSQGVIQNFDSYRTATTIEKLTFDSPRSVTTQAQTLPMGPVASQESIKELGTNGGGFFNANSAHPYENPTTLSNVLEMAAIFLIPLALTYSFGRMVAAR